MLMVTHGAGGGIVALHTEGVDRNPLLPSHRLCRKSVALHTEGVDRNLNTLRSSHIRNTVALHTEGVDRNDLHVLRAGGCAGSPSTRRAWIEMCRGRLRPARPARRPPHGGRG